MSAPEGLGVPDWEFRVVMGRTRIEFDPDKEHINRAKHGYSLESAVSVLESMLLPIGSPPQITSDGFRENDEVRHMHMTVDDCGKVVVLVTTMRPEETVRIISFRRAREAERKKFAATTGFREEV